MRLGIITFNEDAVPPFTPRLARLGKKFMKFKYKSQHDKNIGSSPITLLLFQQARRVNNTSKLSCFVVLALGCSSFPVAGVGLVEASTATCGASVSNKIGWDSGGEPLRGAETPPRSSSESLPSVLPTTVTKPSTLEQRWMKIPTISYIQSV